MLLYRRHDLLPSQSLSYSQITHRTLRPLVVGAYPFHSSAEGRKPLNWTLSPPDVHSQASRLILSLSPLLGRPHRTIIHLQVAYVSRVAIIHTDGTVQSHMHPRLLTIALPPDVPSTYARPARRAKEVHNRSLTDSRTRDPLQVMLDAITGCANGSARMTLR